MMTIRWWRISCVLLVGVWVVAAGVLWWCDCYLPYKINRTHPNPAGPPPIQGYSNIKTTHTLQDIPIEDTKKKKVVCYYTLPNNDSSVPPLTPRDLPLTLCSHIIVAGAQVINNTITPLRPTDIQVYASVVKLKQRVTGLRVLLSLHQGLSSLVRNQLAVSVFAYNAGKFLRRHNFDGLDIDWEGPERPIGTSAIEPKEAERLSYLILQLNNALKLASHPAFLLTAVVGPSLDTLQNLYQPQHLAKNVDFVSVGCYKFHTYSRSLPFTGHNSPLQADPRERGYWATLNLQWAALHWLQAGVPKEKLVVGIPAFGLSWKLKESQWNNVGAPAVSGGMLGGRVSYFQACTFVQEGAAHHYDTLRHATFATRGTDWLSYDDPISVKEKVEWVIGEGVAGVMLRDLNSDDWPGMCGGDAYPLLRAARNAICRTHPDTCLDDPKREQQVVVVE